MSKGIKGLTKVQRDDYYIRVAREQFGNRLENGDKSSGRGSSRSESILISATQLDRWLRNCWIDAFSFECPAQNGGNRDRSTISMLLWRSGFGMGVINANFHCLGTTEVAMDLLNKRASGPQNTGAPRHRNKRRQ